METPHDGLEEVPPVKCGYLGGVGYDKCRDVGYDTLELYEHQKHVFH